MKPIVICRFAPHEGPGYFATYLDRYRLPWQLVRLDNGEKLPRLSEIGGLSMMGGAMSVNDDLPWIPPMLELARECVVNDIPVIGHCLGGQLLSKALGGQVTRNPVKEIGWGEVRVIESAAAAAWAPSPAFLSYHWHGETFSIPEGATRIWSSAHCENQAFVIGRSIAMQCHVEMTEALVESWCESGADEIAAELDRSPAVQTPHAMRVALAARLTGLHRIADAVYGRWLTGVSVSP